MTAQLDRRSDSIPTASVADTLAAVAEIVVPTLSKGVIVRRPKVMHVAEWLDLDRRAVRRMRTLRETYGDGPLMLAIPGRNQALILSPDDVVRVLEETPDPFSPASKEKVQALAHLEPKASLISEGPEREERRRFNEDVLEIGQRVHSMAAPFLRVVEEEAAGLLRTIRRRGGLSWGDYIQDWYRVVRRVVLGDGARDDDRLTDMLADLRAAGNWAFLHPGRDELLDRFHDRVDRHLARAEAGSLAARIAAMPNADASFPSHQVAHWLFAFDPAGMASYRTLALLSSHPEEGERARAEIRAAGADRGDLRFIRASMLEALRLWPTTPAILRESRRDTHWETGIMPRDTSVVIFAPFFHRDPSALPYADRFEPDVWLHGQQRRWPLIPFSGGPGLCPAHQLVPMLGAGFVAALMAEARFELTEPERMDPDRPLPGSQDNYTLNLRLVGRV